MSYEKNNEAYFGGEGLVSTLGDYSNFCKMLLNGGSYDGKKIISQNSINLMTKKYSQSYPNEEFSDSSKLGFYYGFSLFVLENPEIDDTNSSKGIFGWSGYHNTHFWIDPEKKLFAVQECLAVVLPTLPSARRKTWPITCRTCQRFEEP